MVNQTLYCVRGVSGAGKTSLVANLILTLPNAVMVAADDEFSLPDGGYSFEPNRLPYAHRNCLKRAEQALADDVEHVFVCNTFTQEWEMKNDFDIAISHDCRIVTLIVENRHGGKNVHGVPEATLTKMKNRFDVQL